MEIRKVKGKSMYPFLKDGAVVVIDDSELSNLKTNDIILYEGNSSPIIHRIVGSSKNKQGSWFIAKGDNNIWPDNHGIPLKLEKIRGKLVLICYEGKWLSAQERYQYHVSVQQKLFCILASISCKIYCCISRVRYRKRGE